MNKVTKEMTISEVVQKYPESFQVFQKHGLHCMGCAAAHFQNIEQGCTAHGIDADKLIKDLNQVLKKKAA